MVAILAVGASVFAYATRPDTLPERLEAELDSRCDESNGYIEDDALEPVTDRRYLEVLEEGNGVEFRRAVESAKAEIIVISCDVGGPIVRHFGFPDPASASRAVRAHPGQVCRIDNALVDGATVVVAEACESLEGELLHATPR